MKIYKIKDNVNLKELENFGYIKEKCCYRKFIGKYLIEVNSSFYKFYGKIIFHKKKHNMYYFIKSKKKLIKDLIENNLVEEEEKQ